MLKFVTTISGFASVACGFALEDCIAIQALIFLTAFASFCLLDRKHQQAQINGVGPSNRTVGQQESRDSENVRLAFGQPQDTSTI